MPERIYLSPPHMGGNEMRNIEAAFESNYIAPVGPQLDEFERVLAERTGFKHCVALSSGTAAIHLGLRNLGVEAGNVVLASTLTFIGSVSPITFLGAQPVFIDCSFKSWNMNPSLLRAGLDQFEKEGKTVGAVIPTDLYGESCDLDEILEICSHYRVPVLVDAAESLGSVYKGRGAGSGAAAAAFSFNGNKIITTSGGGALVSDDEHLVEKARFHATQARELEAHYEHCEIGYNYRMSNLCAAVGLGQLEVLSDRVHRKREIFAHYAARFSDIQGVAMMPRNEDGGSNCWLTVVLIDPVEFGGDREKVRHALEKENIESRPMWKPMHLQPVFEGAEVIGGAVSEDLFSRGLCLPSGTAMTDIDVDRVVDTFLQARTVS